MSVRAAMCFAGSLKDNGSHLFQRSSLSVFILSLNSNQVLTSNISVYITIEPKALVVHFVAHHSQKGDLMSVVKTVCKNCSSNLTIRFECSKCGQLFCDQCETKNIIDGSSSKLVVRHFCPACGSDLCHVVRSA